MRPRSDGLQFQHSGDGDAVKWSDGRDWKRFSHCLGYIMCLGCGDCPLILLPHIASPLLQTSYPISSPHTRIYNMPLDIMRLRAWALSTNNDGARSDANCQFLDGLLRHGSLAAGSGTTITIDQKSLQGTECISLCFHLPHACRSNGVSSIPVLVPRACIGTGIYQSTLIFYALIEEIIGWLACVGPKHTLVRLYVENNGQQLPRSYSSSWVQRRNSFALFITSMRPSHHQSGLGQMSGAVGVMEVAQAMTSSQDTSGDYIVTLTLGSNQQMRLFLPRSVAQLQEEWRLDWLEVQNEFSTRA